MVDHLNHDTLDNRLINLTYTDSSQNNRNRSILDTKKNPIDGEIIGVTYKETKNLKSFRAMGKYFGKYVTKYFYISKHGYNEAKQLAIEFRKNILEVNVQSPNITLSDNTNIEHLKFALDHHEIILEDIVRNTVLDIDKYIPNVELDSYDKNIMHAKYAIIQYWRERNISEQIFTIRTKINEVLSVHTPVQKPQFVLFSPLCFSTDITLIEHDKLMKDLIVPEKKINKDTKTNNPIDNPIDNIILDKMIKLRRGAIIPSEDENNTNIKIMCEDKHIFDMSYDDLKNGKWCHYCNNSKGELLVREICEKLLGKKFIKIRPNWLKNNETNCNMELDLYNEELKLAFEYDGEQHHRFINYFHASREDFIKQQKKDLLKQQLCIDNDITLIRVPYSIKLNEKDMKKCIIDSLASHDIKYPINNNNNNNKNRTKN